MAKKAPLQFITLPPFATRDWSTVCREYSVLFPDPDIRDGETIIESLARPLKGEHVIYTDIASPSSGAVCASRVLRDSNQLDTGFQVTRIDANSVSISPGSAEVISIYLQITETVTLSLTNQLAVWGNCWPIEANKDYYVVIHPVNSNTHLFENPNTVGISFANTRTLETLCTSFPNIAGMFCLIACVTLNSSGQITNDESITYTHGTFWDREYLAYPPGPPRDPLNGGVLRDDSWYDDWS